MITASLLKALDASNDNAELYAPLLEKERVVANDNFKTISSKPGVAMLVSQLAHESGYFSTLQEDLNYQAKALKTLKNSKGIRYFNDNQADLYGSVKNAKGQTIKKADPRMIANLYYGGRMGNRGVDTDDGWIFRGSGLLQNTGRTNHTAFGKTLGMEAEKAADYTRTPEGAVKAALWYWRTNNLLIPASRGDVTTCTSIINGGTNGLTSRIALYRKALAALG